MNILHLSSEYPPQKIFGLGRYVSGLSRALAAQGHTVHVLTNSLGGSQEDICDEGVYVHRVAFPPPPMPPTEGAPVMAFNVHLQQRSQALGRARLGNPEVIVSHDWLTAVAGHRISKRWGIPHVWTVHDTVHGKRFGIIQNAEDRIAHQIELWASREADLVLANSRDIMREIREVHGAAGDSLALLHPGIEPREWQASQENSRLLAFRSVVAKPDEFLITFAGRFDLEKGIDTLINAFSRFKRHVSRARLVLAGRGKLQPVIEEHIGKLGISSAVTLPGYLAGEVLRALYAVSDVHVCPSHYEPFGLVALEAMAAGAPVIVSDTGGLRDIVPESTIGRRVPPRDPGALAEMLAALASQPNLRKNLAAAGREFALNTFAWPALAQKATDLYQRAKKEASAA